VGGSGTLRASLFSRRSCGLRFLGRPTALRASPLTKDLWHCLSRACLCENSTLASHEGCPEQKGGNMSCYEERALADGTDKSVEMGPAAARDRSVVVRARATPRPLGPWGVRAWVWELRDRGAQHDQAISEREGELLRGDRVIDLNATALTVG
jgi:hypothetical protein